MSCIVFCELRRRKYELYFHKHNYECDFLVKKELQIVHVIQVCVTLEEPETKKREINGLIEAMRTYKLKKGLLLTYSTEGRETIQEDSNQYEIEILPVWKWLLQS